MRIGVKNLDGIDGMAKFLAFGGAVPNCPNWKFYTDLLRALPVVVSDAAWFDGEVDRLCLLVRLSISFLVNSLLTILLFVSYDPGPGEYDG